MTQKSMLTDEVKAAIGIEVVGPPELVEMKTIREYAKAIAWPDRLTSSTLTKRMPRATGLAVSSRHGAFITPWAAEDPFRNCPCQHRESVLTVGMTMNIFSLSAPAT